MDSVIETVIFNDVSSVAIKGGLCHKCCSHYVDYGRINYHIDRSPDQVKAEKACCCSHARILEIFSNSS